MVVVFIDGVFDLFHYGHLKFIKAAKEQGDILYVGILNDDTVSKYKAPPTLTMEERYKVLEGCKYIDRIIKDSPLEVTDELLQSLNVDILVIPNNRTEKEMSMMYSGVNNTKIVRLPYTNSISSTEIKRRILCR